MNPYFDFENQNQFSEAAALLKVEYGALPAGQINCSLEAAILFLPTTRQTGRSPPGAPSRIVLELARSYLDIIRKATVCSKLCKQKYQDTRGMIIGTMETPLGEMVLFTRTTYGLYLFASSMTGGAYQVVGARTKGIFSKKVTFDLLGTGGLKRDVPCLDARECFPDAFTLILQKFNGGNNKPFAVDQLTDDSNMIAPYISDEGHAVVKDQFAELKLHKMLNKNG